MDISPTDKLILRDLQNRKVITLKSSQENSSLSYRQFLRRIDDLVERETIKGWIPIIHPLTLQNKKFSFLFLKTNPKDPQDLEYLKKLDGLESLDGIAGPFSILALLRFKNEQHYLKTLSELEKQFKVKDPTKELHRFQPLEIISFYKYNGRPITEEIVDISSNNEQLLKSLNNLGLNNSRPPSIDDIADHLQISSSSVQKNIKILEEQNAILGYSVLVNEDYRPSIKMIVQFKIFPSAIISFISILQSDPHVTLVTKIQSEYSLLVIVFFSTIKDFNIWLKEMYQITNIEDTQTTVVLENEFETSSNVFPIL